MQVARGRLPPPEAQIGQRLQVEAAPGVSLGRRLAQADENESASADRSSRLGFFLPSAR
jgi:hypothetical protein